MTKAELRRVHRVRRRALTARQQQDHARAVAQFAFAHIAPGDVVGLYIADDGEVDLLPLAQRCWRATITTCIPVVRGESMHFATWEENTELIPGPFAIAEPRTGEPRAPDIVFAPVVAFDERGTRLGRGGGFYDRFLADGGYRVVGVAHECQYAEALPKDEHDVRLDAVVTERGWHAFDP